MNFIDLAAQQKRIYDQIEENIRTVLRHGQYVMGPEIRELEKKLADYVGVKHALGCASGTDALLMALMAYQIGPGDAILTTPFTFVATAEVIGLLGATPIFVDIDPKTFNIDPDKLELAIRAFEANDPSIHPMPYGDDKSRNAEGLTLKGVIPVDLFGLTADYDRIEAVAHKHDLFVIEDAAQSFGAVYRGRKACSFGQIACTSFFPAKPLGCYGDGGMCFTDDDNLAHLLGSIRIHGQGSHRYENVRLGINGRLDTLQAAILLAKFDIFPEEVDLRNKVAYRYSELLAGCHDLVAPNVPEHFLSVWAQYAILSQNEDHRRQMQAKLEQANVPTAIYYPIPLHLQKAFHSLGYREGDFPVSEDYAKRVFSIPMHPYLDRVTQEKIASLIKD